MAWLMVGDQHAASANSSTATTPAMSTVGCDVIVVYCSLYANGSSVLAGDLSDSASNSWTFDGIAQNTSDGNVQVAAWHVFSPTTNASHTFTFNHVGTTQFPTLAVEAWSGSDKTTAPIKGTGQNGAGSTSQAVTASGSVIGQLNTTATVFPSAISTLAIDTGFSLDLHSDWTTGLHMGQGVATHVATANGENPAWSWTTSAECAAMMLTFTPAAAPAGGGGGTLPFMMVPFSRAVAYTASDTADIPSYMLELKPSQAVMATGGGNINCVFPNGLKAVLPIVAGVPVPAAVRRINSASTTATGLTLLYL
jgi:hypothetical protein